MGKIAYFVLVTLLATLFLATPESSAHARSVTKTERTAPWNSETSDLEADSRIVYGRLPNGLRYAIRRNDRPENQVLVRMVVEFGSAAEADNEQGLAHFIEHMAFNGSTNIAEGEMVRMLERLGLSFGADTNASTGYLQTQYKLDLPKSDPKLIDQALFLMRETASEVLFNPAAVDRERGVVIAEMRDRENHIFQRNRAQNSQFYPGSFYATRYPIGTLEVLQTAPADRMKALYRKWYVPDRTRLVIVGPVDPAEIEKAIAKHFTTWNGQGGHLGDLEQCTFDNQRPMGAAFFTHPEISESISVEQILPDRPRPDTFERALLDVKMRIANSIVADRISRKQRKEDVPFLGSSLTFAAGFCDKHARVGFGVSAKDGEWRSSLPIVEKMIRQAVAYGFDNQEVAEQLKRFDASFDNAVRSEATTNSIVFASELANLDEDIVTAADYRKRLWLQLRPFLSSQSIHGEFSKWYGQLARPQIFVSGRKLENISEAEIVAAYEASRKEPVSAPEARNAKEWVYTDFGSPGQVAEDKRIDDLGIRTIRFANGVMLNLKKTDFEKDRIRWSLRIDGGRLAFSQSDQPLAMFMDGAFVGGGLGAYDIDELRSVLAGSTAVAAFSTGPTYFGGSSAVVSKDLERQMQLLAAIITDPGYREEAVRLFRRPLPEFYSRLNATPGSALSIGQARIMNEGDARFTLPPQEKLMAADFDALKTALGSALATNRLEIGLVGDLDEENAIAVIGRTFGALPGRATSFDIPKEALKAEFAKNYGVHEIPHRGQANQMSWRRTWPTTDDSDMRLEQTMSLLAAITQIRLIDELRENLGATYGAGAGSDMSDIFPGRGSFSVSTSGDPKDLEKIEKAVEKVIEELVAAPVSADLFERGRKPTLESYADWLRRNQTWMQIVDQAQTEPDRIERFRQNESSFRSITPEDVWQAAQRFLKNQPSYIFRVLPESERKPG